MRLFGTFLRNYLNHVGGAALLCSLAIVGCTKKDETAKVTFQLPAVTEGVTAKNSKIASKSLSQSAVHASATQWSYPAPNAMNEVKCYAVVVETPGIGMPGVCSKLDGTRVMMPTVVYGPVAGGSAISVEVPSGPMRKIALVAFAADTTADCAQRVGQLPNTSLLSPPRIVGKVEMDLSPGNNDVMMSASLTNSTEFESCTNWGASVVMPVPTPGPSPTASPSPSPSPSPTSTPFPLVYFSQATQTVGEGDGTVSFTLNLDQVLAVPVNVTVAVTGTSAYPSDHDMLNGTILTIGPGSISQAFTFNLTDDSTYEGNETVALNLSSPMNAGLGTPATQTITISDDDPVPVDTSLSDIDVQLTTLASGSDTTINIYMRDGLGNIITSASGHTIVVDKSTGAGVSTGTLDTVTYAGAGVYTTTFHAQGAGTPTTISATVDGVSLGMNVQITVTPGALNISNSTMSFDANSVEFNGTTTLHLVARDTYGNRLASGGLTPTVTGTSTVLVAGGFNDYDNGTYSWTVFGASIGTASTVGIDIGGTAIGQTQSFSVTPIFLTVGPAYPTNAPNWNGMIKYNNASGTHPWDQADVACTGSETAGYGKLNGCVNGGLIRKVPVPGISTCTNLTIADSLGVLKWVCQVDAGTATFYSTDFMPGKGLRDLIPSGSWVGNSVTVSLSGQPIASSLTTNWWTNSLYQISATGTGPATSLSTAGAIYYTNANTTVYGLAVTAANVSVVTLNGSVLTSTGVTQNFTGSDCSMASSQMLCSNQNFLWIEADIDGTGATALMSGLRLAGRFNRVHRSYVHDMRSASGNIFAGIELEAAGGNSLITETKTYKTGQAGGVRLLSGNNIVRNFDASTITFPSLSSQTLFYLSGTDNAVYDVRLANLNVSGSSSYAMKITGSSHIVSGLNISNVAGSVNPGILLASAASPIITNVTINGTTDAGIFFSNGSGATIAHVTTVNNTNNGFYLATAISNLYVHNFVSINAAKGIENAGGATGSGNLFSNIVSASNSTYNVELPGAQSIAFEGYLDVGSVGGDSCSGGGLGGSCSGYGALTTNFVNAFVGKVADTANPHASAGTTLRSTIVDWISFQNPYRNWGVDNVATFPAVVFKGACTATTCQAWDWRAKTGGPLEYTSAYGSSPNATFTAGLPCPAEVSGTNSAMYKTVNSKTFLKYAIEINDDEIGNDNGLCETNESCIYAPNRGSYQGDGNYKAAGTCNFTGSAITGVEMYAYPNSGG